MHASLIYASCIHGYIHYAYMRLEYMHPGYMHHGHMPALDQNSYIGQPVHMTSSAIGKVPLGGPHSGKKESFLQFEIVTKFDLDLPVCLQGFGTCCAWQSTGQHSWNAGTPEYISQSVPSLTLRKNKLYPTLLFLYPTAVKIIIMCR